MIKVNKNHIGYYITLLTILILGFIMIVSASFSKQLQMIIIILIALFYVGWGILHHLINHDLTPKIVVEYVLIGSFGIAAVFFLLKGALY